MRSAQLLDLARRFIAAGCAVVVFALGVLGASPIAHEQLHQHSCSKHPAPAPDAAEDSCAIVLFAHGVSLPLAAIAIEPPLAPVLDFAARTADEVFLLSPRYLRQPERGPPLS